MKTTIITVKDLKEVLSKFTDDTPIVTWNQREDYPDYKMGRLNFAEHIYAGLSDDEIKNQKIHLDIL